MGVNVVDLTPIERKLYDQVFLQNFQDIYEKENVSEAAAKLTQSLIKRSAIPMIRIHFFTDPAFNIGTKLSRQQVFEKNGTYGVDIFKHNHFKKYLFYFINGPELPREIIEAFCKIVESQSYISSSDIPILWNFARQVTKKNCMDPKFAAEEFYKLALECGIDNGYARLIRDVVRNTKQ